MPSSADDIKDQVLLTQLIERPLSSANFPFLSTNSYTIILYWIHIIQL